MVVVRLPWVVVEVVESGKSLLIRKRFLLVEDVLLMLLVLEESLLTVDGRLEVTVLLLLLLELGGHGSKTTLECGLS